MIPQPRSLLLIAAASATLLGCGEAFQDPSAPEPEPAAANLDDAEYLYRLGLIRGHLLVGNALFELGERDAARTHSKHPTDELYAPMEVEFRARGVSGFAAELEAHASAVDTGDEATVAERYAVLVERIAATEDAVVASAELGAQVIVKLVREAGREYAIGIVDGKLANAHEYQDAYGFTQIAHAWAQRLRQTAPEVDRPVFEEIGDALSSLADMWPSLMPPPELPQRAARLYGTAAEVEIKALAIGA